MVVIASPSNATWKRFKAEAYVHVDPGTLHLVSDKVVVNSGDPVTFTGVITPPGVPYSVLGWSWQPDYGGGVATLADVSQRQHHLRIWPQPESASPDGETALASLSAAFELDSLIAAEVDEPYSLIDDTPLTAACSHDALECITAVYQSGTMTILAEINGDQQERSVHVTVDWTCPATWPIDGIVSTGGIQISVPATWIRVVTGEPLSTQLGVVFGPWTLLYAFGPNDPSPSGFPVAHYAPDSGYLLSIPGYSLIRSFSLPLVAGESYVEFECRTQLNMTTGLWEGKMHYLNRANVYFAPLSPN